MAIFKLFAFLFVFNSYNNSLLQDNFYTVLSSNDKAIIETEIVKLKSLEKTRINLAYIATLKMKKSNFEKVLKDRINLFKEGATELEILIKQSPKEVELKFLRFIIQENAPKILKYNQSIQLDKDFIIREFSIQKTELKKHIAKYAENSKNLNPDNLNE